MLTKLPILVFADITVSGSILIPTPNSEYIDISLFECIRLINFFEFRFRELNNSCLLNGFAKPKNKLFRFSIPSINSYLCKIKPSSQLNLFWLSKIKIFKTNLI